MNQGFINLRDVEIFVLDEADRMLDMGFIHDVKKVIAKLPAIRQTLFFSATMPKEIQSLADTILRNPVKVEVTPVSSTAEKIQQQIFFVSKNDKKDLLLHILKDRTIETALVFARTKHGSDRIVKDLIKAGIKAEAIHGNKSQNARQRALTNFKAKTTRILVATDIAARGIDVDELAHVINYELPNIPETYVHRIGRTGRAGLSGTALSFCDGEEKEFLDDIEKLIGLKVPVTEDHPYAMSWQSLMAGAAEAKAKGKSKPSRGARPQRTEKQPNLSGAKKTPGSGGGGGRKWHNKSRQRPASS
jgi:ATP-dependent RNA helicase RhlE